MKCHNCTNTQADTRLLINFMGQVAEIYFCADCLNDLRRQTQASGFPLAQQSYDWPGFEQNTPAQEDPDNGFELDAGDDIKRQRLLCELREKLKDAVAAENYEAAAILRDEIYRMEKEVRV